MCPRGGAGDVDWRAYAATKGLTEKQQKLADKIRKREARIQNLQREIDKIKVGFYSAATAAATLRMLPWARMLPCPARRRCSCCLVLLLLLGAPERAADDGGA